MCEVMSSPVVFEWDARQRLDVSRLRGEQCQTRIL